MLELSVQVSKKYLKKNKEKEKRLRFNKLQTRRKKYLKSQVEWSTLLVHNRTWETAINSHLRGQYGLFIRTLSYLTKMKHM